jgi:hypothetical protein
METHFMLLKYVGMMVSQVVICDNQRTDLNRIALGSARMFIDIFANNHLPLSIQALTPVSSSTTASWFSRIAHATGV